MWRTSTADDDEPLVVSVPKRKDQAPRERPPLEDDGILQERVPPEIGSLFDDSSQDPFEGFEAEVYHTGDEGMEEDDDPAEVLEPRRSHRNRHPRADCC